MWKSTMMIPNNFSMY